MQDWKMTDKSAGLEFAGLENDGQKMQGWKMTDRLLNQRQRVIAKCRPTQTCDQLDLEGLKAAVVCPTGGNCAVPRTYGLAHCVYEHPFI